MKSQGLLAPTLMALALLAGLTVALIALYRFTQSDFILGIVGAVASVWLASYQFRKAKEHEAEARLFTEKSKVYVDLIETLMGIFYKHKDAPESIDQTALVAKLQSLRTQLLIWGSSETVLALDRMGELTAQSATDGLTWMARLFGAIRKDLGHNDPSGANIDLALGILVPKDRVAARAQLGRAK